MSDMKTEQANLEEESNGMPIILTALVWLVAFAITIYKIIMVDNGGFEHSIPFLISLQSHFEYPLALQQVIIQALAAVVIAPLIHIGIASFWQSKRNSRTHKNIFLGWSIFAIIGALILISQV